MGQCRVKIAKVYRQIYRTWTRLSLEQNKMEIFLQAFLKEIELDFNIWTHGTPTEVCFVDLQLN